MLVKIRIVPFLVLLFVLFSGFAENSTDSVHIKLIRPVIIINAVLLLLYISQLRIAKSTNMRHAQDHVCKRLKASVKLFQCFWILSIAP